MKNDDVIITVYAPVIIHTLNRYVHLKRLLESLERNPLAQYTEVFISVDFPPGEQYEVGYRKIVEYLNSRKFGFKRTNLYFQDSNLGVNKNYVFLENLVFERYDRVISLEDDNEVSENFLEYMDKALEYGKNKNDIAMVTGFSGYYILPKNVTGSAFTNHVPNCWGAGLWRDKEARLKENITNEWVHDISCNWRKLFKLYRNNKITFINFCASFVFSRNRGFYENGKIQMIDTIRSLDVIFNDKYVICPTISKVRNWGNDGSGVNGGLNKEQMKFVQPLDESDQYKFVMESNALTCKKIQRYIRNKRRFSYSEKDAIIYLMRCFYFLNIKKHGDAR